MKKEFSSSVSWNSAALAGLVMGVFTIAVDYLPSLPLLLGGTGVFVGILNFILKVVKIVACVIAFKYLLERFHNNVKVGYPELQRYGQKIALFSSILVSGFTMLQLLVINPDMIAQVVKSTQEAYQGMMDSNTATAMEKMMNMIPGVHVCLHIALLLPLGMDALNRIRQKTVPCQRFRRAHSG